MRYGLAAVVVAWGMGLSGGAFAACPVPANVEELRADVARLMNAERRQRGLPALSRSDKLQGIAQDHACDMAENGIRSHTGTRGATFPRRYQRGGGCGAGGENIGRGYRTPGAMIAAWMNSGGHRANILHRQAPQYGIGIAVAGDGPSWVMVVGQGC